MIIMQPKITLLSFCFFLSIFGWGQTYEVVNISISCESKPVEADINSGANEFSPFVHDYVLYFSSDRDPDILTSGGNNWEKNKVINLFQAEIKSEISESAKIKKPRLVSEKFTTLSHTGPASFSSTGDTMFYSQVKVDDKEGKFFPQLFYSVRYNNRWLKPTALPFNDKKYIFSHPFYDSNSQKLYFVSNKEGGKGGKDIYYSELTDKGWQAPKALVEVNTVSNELYPFIGQGILFYSSDKAGSKGGLDVYWKILGSDKPVKPLDGLNSESDDFGLYAFAEMTKGYYSSSRNGQDDIFYFSMDKVEIIRHEMAGEFRYKNLNGMASGLTIQILDENDYVLQSTTTDENGQFVFREIDPKTNYSIKALSEEDLELTLKNQNGEQVIDMLGDQENVFSYRKIGAEKSGTLSLIPGDMMDFGLNEGHLTGQLVYENKPGEHPGSMRVVLVDDKGKEHLSTLTDEKGNFDFKKLSLSQNYLLKIPEADDDIVLLVFDLKGNVVAELKTNESGEFTYRKLNPDFGNKLTLAGEDDLAFEFNSQTIWGYFEYDNTGISDRGGLEVNVYTEDGQLIASESTDEEGNFRFRSLPVEKSLLFKLEDGDNNFILDDFTLFIFDRDGNKVAVLKRGEEGFFTFRPLGYDLNNQLSELEEDNLDFILGGYKDRQLIVVYFDSNQEQVKSGDLKIINNLYKVLTDNPKAKVEVNAYADSKSSDEYNLILSEKRANWIVEYLLNKGISSNRFTINAYGESRIIDENNDALNRRAEIHIY